MQIHAEVSSEDYGPIPAPRQECIMADRKVHDVSVIDLTGPLVRELPVLAFRDQIRELLDQGTQDFAINLAGVSYADSYGVGGLAAAYNLVHQAGGRIKFFAAPERLVRTLRRLRLDTILELVDDEASALSTLR